MQFRNDIQGLRALAFLSVFIFHLNLNWLPGGFLGVDLFFVLSGYLMTSITISDIDKDRFTFVNFYRKRMKRILPAYYIMLLVVCFFGITSLLYIDLNAFFRSLKYSMLFVSNLIFSEGNSYFGAKLSENPFLHTWSLSLEMQFYFILPLIIYFFKRQLKIIFVILILLFTLYSSYNIYILDNKSLMYFSLGARIPEFLIGSLYAILFTKKLDLGTYKNNLFAILSLLIFLICIFLMNEDSNFPGVLVLIPCIAISNLLVLKENIISKFLSNKVLVVVGTYSYSLYLWHWPIMAFIRYKNNSYDLSGLEIFLTVFLTLTLSWLSYKFIESYAKSFSDLKTILCFGTLFVGIFIISFKFKDIKSINVIDKLYCEPYFGEKSHYNGFVEKFGNSKLNDKIVLLGDSHALMLKPFFDTLGKRNGFSLKSLTNDSFLAFPNVKKEDIIDKSLYGLYDKSRANVSKIETLVQDNELIIINVIDFKRYPSYKKAIDSLANTIRPNQKILLINTFPLIDKNPIRENRGIINKGLSKIKKIENQENFDFIKKLDDTHDNLYFYDLSKSSIFITPGYINDTVAYYDDKHINTYGSYKLAEDLETDFMLFFNKIRNKEPKKQ
ncbi:acyltransferase [Flavobacterium agricola]|uniref:Acyltransferase n=1 Tax=Flavobacterium agricola TaxID=2870839 RepID=A0ABY6M2N7_9FLAO|nr:acyltransferase family protein [Flavobacterium agricola]UYW01573.1 acyltransferase [Flavobacterium agricola]